MTNVFLKMNKLGEQLNQLHTPYSNHSTVSEPVVKHSRVNIYYIYIPSAGMGFSGIFTKA
jgi:hypothetical protein